MKRAALWLLDHWYIPIGAVVAALAWFAGASMRSPAKAVKDDIADAKEVGEIRQQVVEKGAALANALVDMRYNQTLASIDAAERRKLDDLRDDPVKRVKRLAKLARRAPVAK